MWSPLVIHEDIAPLEPAVIELDLFGGIRELNDPIHEWRPAGRLAATERHVEGSRELILANHCRGDSTINATVDIPYHFNPAICFSFQLSMNQNKLNI